MPFTVKSRLGTKEEYKQVCLFFAKSYFEQSKKLSLPVSESIEEISKEYEEDFRDNILAFDINKSATLFLCLFAPDDGDYLTIAKLSVLKIGHRWVDLGKVDMLSKETIDNIEKWPLTEELNKVGRPKRPQTENINKAFKVVKLRSEEKISINAACKKVGVPKSTYYRVMAWLDDQSNIFNVDL